MDVITVTNIKHAHVKGRDELRETTWQDVITDKEKKKRRAKEQNSLCLCPDLSVHYGCSGDAAGQWVYLKQATHG